MPDVLIPRRPATVAVVESRIQGIHYPELSPRSSLACGGPPWIQYEWFDEGTLDVLLRGLESHRFAAVLVASGALQLPAIAAALNSPEFVSRMRARVQHGMGLVVMQTFAASDRRLLDFLPPGMDVWAVPHEAADALALEYKTHFERKLSATLAATDGLLPPEMPLPPERALLAVLRAEDGDHQEVVATLPSGEAVIVASRGASGRVYVSTVPLDQMGSHALHAMLVRSVRANGILLIRQTPAASPIEEREYLDWLAVEPESTHLCETVIAAGSQSSIDIGQGRFACFGHIVFASPWTWDGIPAVHRRDLLLRLENGGSITALVRASSGDTHWLSLAGATRAIVVARRYAEWLSAHGRDVADSPLLVIRAAARVNAALGAAVTDWDDVPALVRPEFARSLYEDALRARLCGRQRDNVDGLLLPTAALLSACDDLGVELESRTAILKWMRRRFDSATPASILQAATWVPELRHEVAVASACESALSTSFVDRSLEVHALGLAAHTGDLALSEELVEQRIVSLLADDGLDALAKATLAETVLSAADGFEVSDQERARRLRTAVRTTSSDVVAVASAKDKTESPELSMLAFATALRLESHSRLGYKCAGPVRSESQTWPMGGAVVPSAEAERLDLETKRKALSREVDDLQSALASTRRAGQWLLMFALAMVAGVIGLVFVLFSRAIATFWSTNALGKDIVLLAIPVAFGAVGFLTRRLLSPTGLIPPWLGGGK